VFIQQKDTITNVLKLFSKWSANKVFLEEGPKITIVFGREGLTSKCTIYYLNGKKAKY